MAQSFFNMMSSLLTALIVFIVPEHCLQRVLGQMWLIVFEMDQYGMFYCWSSKELKEEICSGAASSLFFFFSFDLQVLACELFGHRSVNQGLKHRSFRGRALACRACNLQAKWDKTGGLLWGRERAGHSSCLPLYSSFAACLLSNLQISDVK